MRRGKGGIGSGFKAERNREPRDSRHLVYEGSREVGWVSQSVLRVGTWDDPKSELPTVTSTPRGREWTSTRGKRRLYVALRGTSLDI